MSDIFIVLGICISIAFVAELIILLLNNKSNNQQKPVSKSGESIILNKLEEEKGKNDISLKMITELGVIFVILSIVLYSVEYLSAQRILDNYGVNFRPEWHKDIHLLMIIAFSASVLASVFILMKWAKPLLPGKKINSNKIELATWQKIAPIISILLFILFIIVPPFNATPVSSKPFKLIVNNNEVAFALGLRLTEWEVCPFDKISFDNFKKDFQTNKSDKSEKVWFLNIKDTTNVTKKLRYLYEIKVINQDGLPDTVELKIDDSVLADSKLKALKILGDTIYAKIRLNQTNNASLADSLAAYMTDSPEAFDHLLKGLIELNKYTDESLHNALEQFDLALEADEFLNIVNIYKSNIFNLLIDKRFNGLDIRAYLDSSNHYTTIGAKHLPPKHPLKAKVIADNHFVKASILLDSCFLKDIENKKISTYVSLLDQARTHLIEAQNILADAIDGAQNDYKLIHNLTSYYLLRSSLELLSGDTIAARVYIDLAVFSAKETNGIFIHNSGPNYLLAYAYYSIYRDFEPENVFLRDSAISIIQSILNDSPDNLPLFNYWKSSSLMILAAIEIHSNEFNSKELNQSDLSNLIPIVEYLMEAENEGCFNIYSIMETDKDFQVIIRLLRKYNHSSLMDLLNSLKLRRPS